MFWPVRVAWGVFHATFIVLANIQVFLSLPLAIIAPNAFRKVVATFSDWLWPASVWGMESFAGNSIQFFGDDFIRKEPAIVIANHVTASDFAFIMCVAWRARMLGSLKFILKSSIRYIPFIGTAIEAMRWIFISRRWEDDKVKLARAFTVLKDFQDPFWLVIFPEGTRFTKEKHEAGIQYAKDNNLPQLNNLLLPRTKGFVSAVTNLGPNIRAVYDITFVLNSKPNNNVASIVTGLGAKTDLHVVVKRIPIEEVPTTDPAKAEEWIINRWVEKDKLIGKWRNPMADKAFLGYPLAKRMTLDSPTFSYAMKMKIVWTSLLLATLVPYGAAYTAYSSLRARL